MFLGLREPSIGKPLLIGAGGPLFGTKRYGIALLFALGGILFIGATDGIGNPSLGDRGISIRFLAIWGPILPDVPTRCAPGPVGAEKFDVPLGPLNFLGPLGPLGPFGPENPLEGLGPLNLLGPLGPLGPFGPENPLEGLGPLNPLGLLEPAGPLDPLDPLDPLPPLGTFIGFVEPLKRLGLVTPLDP